MEVEGSQPTGEEQVEEGGGEASQPKTEDDELLELLSK
jgi:hypothetical protein